MWEWTGNICRHDFYGQLEISADNLIFPPDCPLDNLILILVSYTALGDTMYLSIWWYQYHPCYITTLTYLYTGLSINPYSAELICKKTLQPKGFF